MRTMRLNMWVWTKAVRQSGKSSGSRKDSKTASGQQASITAKRCTSSAEMRYKLAKGGGDVFSDKDSFHYPATDGAQEACDAG